MSAVYLAKATVKKTDFSIFEQILLVYEKSWSPHHENPAAGP